jgi:hypothetical protein
LANRPGPHKRLLFKILSGCKNLGHLSIPDAKTARSSLPTTETPFGVDDDLLYRIPIPSPVLGVDQFSQELCSRLVAEVKVLRVPVDVLRGVGQTLVI